MSVGVIRRGSKPTAQAEARSLAGAGAAVPEAQHSQDRGQLGNLHSLTGLRRVSRRPPLGDRLDGGSDPSRRSRGSLWRGELALRQDGLDVLLVFRGGGRIADCAAGVDVILPAGVQLCSAPAALQHLASAWHGFSLFLIAYACVSSWDCASLLRV